MARPRPSTKASSGRSGMGPDVNQKLRTLAHDLSNSIEAMMQASYLLQQSKLDAASKRWADVIDSAVRDSARINRKIRELLRAHTPKGSSQ